MATVSVSKWTPFGVALDLTAGNITITRTSASKFTVHLSVSWKTSWEDAQTDYGMDVTSGGVTKTISTQGTKRGSGSGSLTGTYSISTNGASTVPITVTFRNYNTWADKSATKSLTLNVSVPAWTSYTVTYNANGGSGAPAKQTKWKDQTLTLSSTKPTRTGHTFQGWATSSGSSTVAYKAGGSYTSNAGATLYAVWKANTYTITYNANGGTGAPGTQTKTYGVDLTLSSTKPTRTNYLFKGWGTSASTSAVAYIPGAKYVANNNIVLYAVWELAYTKPKISNLTVDRGNINFDTGEWTTADDGNSVLVQFEWSTFAAVQSVTVKCHGVETVTATASGTSGTVSEYVGSGKLSTDSTYTIEVTVADGDGSAYKTSLTRTLPGAKFVIDFRAGGTGAAIGKPAELDGVFDVEFQTKLTGGLLYPILEPCDLDEKRTPNIYSGRNVKDYSYTCGTNPLPFSNGTFTLEVLSSGPNGQILQRLIVCDKNNSQVYERWYYTSSWSEWTGGWITATLSGEFAMYGTDVNTNQPKYRKDGRLVEVRGAVTPVNDIATGDDMHTILTLPVGYRPSSPIYLISQGSGSRIWLLRINTSGTVDFSRYRNGEAREIATAGTWLPFQCTFLVG